ncbi:MAG: hypothetical protein ACR2PM_04480 [Hyphomicrobiales bacterium]
MTGRSEHLGTPRSSGISHADLPLGNRLQTSLMLGDLTIAVARWVRGQMLSQDIRRSAHMAPKHPSEPCGVF